MRAALVLLAAAAAPSIGWAAAIAAALVLLSSLPWPSAVDLGRLLFPPPKG